MLRKIRLKKKKLCWYNYSLILVHKTCFPPLSGPLQRIWGTRHYSNLKKPIHSQWYKNSVLCRPNIPLTPNIICIGIVSSTCVLEDGLGFPRIWSQMSWANMSTGWSVPYPRYSFSSVCHFCHEQLCQLNFPKVKIW